MQPTGVIIFNILPLLDIFSLAKVSLTCVTLQKTVSDFLATNRVLDMKPVLQKLGNDYPKLKKALMFLTNNLSVTSLREFRFAQGYPLAWVSHSASGSRQGAFISQQRIGEPDY